MVGDDGELRVSEKVVPTFFRGPEYAKAFQFNWGVSCFGVSEAAAAALYQSLVAVFVGLC